MATRTERGFSLIEAAVAIAVVAILAGAIAPLTVKAVNQQREARTRDALKAAFEGMFGSRDRRLANMRADYGFDPGVALGDLSALVVRTGTGGPGAIANYGQDADGMFFGYNGPYWSGSTDGANRPLDGWGRPLQLRWFAATSSWQAFSLGADGVDNTGGATAPAGDDLAYPVVPAPVQSFKAGLIVNIVKPSAVAGTLSITDRLDGATHAVALTPVSGTLAAGTTTYSFACNPVSGGVKITLTRAGLSTLVFNLDLLPGEVRQFDVSI